MYEEVNTIGPVKQLMLFYEFNTQTKTELCV